MGLKLLLFLCAAAAGLAAGSAYSRKLAARKRYFSEYRRFLRYVRTDLGLRRTDILTLAGAFETADPLLCKHLAEYAAALPAGGGKLSRGHLTAEEAETVRSTLFSIGRVDADTQLAELKSAEADAEERLKTAEVRCEKYGAAAIKLGLLAGVGLGILLL